MRILASALGTRGDVQPMIALSKGLQAAGHTVTLIAGANFKGLVEEHGLRFVPTIDIEAMMKSPEGIAWVEEPNPLKQLGHMKALLKPHGAQMVAPLVEHARDHDLLISGFVSEPFGQTISEQFGILQINTSLQPYRPTHSGAASMAPILPNRNSPLNRWMGYFAERLVWGVAAETTNALRQSLGLPPHNAASYYRAARHIPVIYGFSPAVVPPADDWGEGAYVAGYWFLDEHADYQPPAAVAHFLEAGAPPIYIGFGSMSSSSPQATLTLISDALARIGQRGIVASGWSGAQNAGLPDHVCVINGAPHDWLFTRVAAVVHHGGAGTTAAGLRAGKPTLIVPHMSDQPFWAQRVYALGVGAKPTPRHQLTVEKLAAGMQTLVSDQAMIARAAALGATIRAEHGVENAVRLIEQIAQEQR